MTRSTEKLQVVCGLLLQVWAAFFAAGIIYPADASGAPNNSLSSYTVFAINDLRSKGLTVAAGNIGVNDGLLFVHDRLSAPTSEVVANTIRIDERSSCQALYGNAVQTTGPNCSPGMPFASPLFPDVAGACGFPALFPQCGGNAVAVAPGAALTLPPGTYGALNVGPGAQLELAGGNYVFCSVRAARNARIDVAAASEIDVVGSVSLGNQVVFGPAAGAGIAPSDIRVYVAGLSVHYSRMSAISAAVCAPNALARLTQGGQHDGQLIALRIRTEHVGFSPAAPAEFCGGPGPVCGGECPQGQTCVYFFGEGCGCI